MIIFDYIFYTIYGFLNRRLKRNTDDAKHSALCILAVYISFFIPTVACIIGVIYDNSISQNFIHNGFLISVIIAVISYIIFRIRYYKIYNIENIEQKIIQLSNQKKQILKCFYYFFIIGTPVMFFCFGRLYEFGYI